MPLAIRDVGARALLLPTGGGAGARSSGAAFLLRRSSGSRGIGRSTSLLLPHCTTAMRPKEVAWKRADLVQHQGRDERRESRGVAAMAMKTKDEGEQMRNYHHSTAT